MARVLAQFVVGSGRKFVRGLTPQYVAASIKAILDREQRYQWEPRFDVQSA